MKIFNSQQIYNADKFTIDIQGISSDVLMERTATAIFNWMHARLQGNPIKIHVFCGIGNNGGDGIALARLLLENDYHVVTYVVNYSDKRSKDFLLNLDRLKERKVWPKVLNGASELPEIHQDDIIVDAIFGIGLNRPPMPWVVQLINHLNNSNAFLLAVDIPSGLFMEQMPKKGEVIQANYVLSIQFPKLPFFLPDTGVYVNQWELLDIGLDFNYVLNTEATYEMVEKQNVLPLYIPRLKFSHKGSYGHATIIGGSYGKIGAVNLAAKACLSTGSGLVTAVVPKCGYVPLQTAIPEVMVKVDKEEEVISAIQLPERTNAVGIGIGMGTNETTAKALRNFLKENKAKLVVDADALNILAEHEDLLEMLPEQSILTPHPGELKRLIGEWTDDFEKLKMVKSFSKQYNVVVVVKGAHSITVYQDNGYINSTGNPGMATAGSGDVLLGIITALLAQNYQPIQAALFGTYVHGLAGDIGASQVGFEALTASIVIANIGNSFKELHRVEQPVGETQQDAQ